MSDLCFIKASPYQDDELNLPVKDLDKALPFYEKFMRFECSGRNSYGSRGSEENSCGFRGSEKNSLGLSVDSLGFLAACG